MKNILCFLIVLPFIGISQNYQFKNYTFTDDAIAVPDQFKNEGEINLLINRKSELVNNKDGSSTEVNLYHEKILLNSDEAVERNNRIYIPFRQDESLLKNQVRVILKDGKIIKFNDKEIQQETNSETGVTYKYFAVKGLEKGATIEKIFILLEQPDLTNNTIYIQESKPTIKFNYEFIYPKHLEFKYKAYAGCPEAVIKEDAYKDLNSLTVTAENIEAIDDDVEYGNSKRYAQKFKYKLDNNNATGAQNMFNYKEFASRLYESFNVEIDKKEAKSIEEFFKLKKDLPLFDKVAFIENKVKGEIVYDQYYEGNKSISQTLKVKKGNETDFVKLLMTAFRHYNIKNEIVFTSNRFKNYFDEDFETTGNLKDVLLYFPDLDMYLHPTFVDERLPIIPYGLAHTPGLFIKEKEFGGAKMGIAKVDFIKISDLTRDTMNITIDLSKDPENPVVTSDIIFNGYAAIGFQPIKDYAQPDQYKDILKNIAKNYSIEADEYLTLKTQNDGLINVGKKPFILNMKFNSPELVQKAGNNYLVKVGETIGRQSELYDKKERKIPIEIHYPHYYNRKITLILPDGYKVSNPDETKMYYETIVDGEKAAVFDSHYKQDNNTFIIDNDEYYKLIDYPLEVYKPYREVINAAADFNKIVLVLKNE